MKNSKMQGQRWDYVVQDRKLKFRLVQKNGKPGAWRRVKGHHSWNIGEGSGLPQNLFQDLQEAILGPVMRIGREKRQFDRVLDALPRGFEAAALLFGCELAKKSATSFKFTQGQKASMSFRVVDFRNHDAEEFFRRDKQGKIVRGKKKKSALPRRDLRKLVDELHKRERFGIARWERKSQATFRWLIVVFAPSVHPYAERNVWLVPAKAREN